MSHAVDYIRTAILRDKQYRRLFAAMHTIKLHILQEKNERGDCVSPIERTVQDALNDCQQMEDDAKP
jgi:hypothetical protein